MARIMQSNKVALIAATQAILPLLVPVSSPFTTPPNVTTSHDTSSRRPDLDNPHHLSQSFAFFPPSHFGDVLGPRRRAVMSTAICHINGGNYDDETQELSAGPPFHSPLRAFVPALYFFQCFPTPTPHHAVSLFVRSVKSANLSVFFLVSGLVFLFSRLHNRTSSLIHVNTQHVSSNFPTTHLASPVAYYNLASPASSIMSANICLFTSTLLYVY